MLGDSDYIAIEKCSLNNIHCKVLIDHETIDILPFTVVYLYNKIKER